LAGLLDLGPPGERPPGRVGDPVEDGLELVDPQLGETVDDTGKVLGDVVRNLGSSY